MGASLRTFYEVEKMTLIFTFLLLAGSPCSAQRGPSCIPSCVKSAAKGLPSWEVQSPLIPRGLENTQLPNSSQLSLTVSSLKSSSYGIPPFPMECIKTFPWPQEMQLGIHDSHQQGCSPSRKKSYCKFDNGYLSGSPVCECHPPGVRQIAPQHVEIKSCARRFSLLACK